MESIDYCNLHSSVMEGKSLESLTNGGLVDGEKQCLKSKNPSTLDAGIFVSLLLLEHFFLNRIFVCYAYNL